MSDKIIFKINGFLGALLLLVVILFAGGLFFPTVVGIRDQQFSEVPTLLMVITSFVLFATSIVCITGFVIVQPNQARVCTLFGKYVGTINTPGFYLTIPLTVKEHVSLRVMNFNSEKLKVNDLEGNPIEIAAVIVYRVFDPARAVFDVERYQQFVHVQSESGIRHVASLFPYDNLNNPGEITLRQHSDEVCDILKNDLQKRFELAGVEILEARIMHLAYSSEIAAAMLQRQQASAVLSARKTIVLGAVSMVKDAIEQLSVEKVVELDEDKKAQMVNNLLVAIVSEKGTQPVMNNGNI